MSKDNINFNTMPDTGKACYDGMMAGIDMCYKLIAKAVIAKEVRSNDIIQQYTNLLDKCENMLSFLLDCEVEHSATRMNVKQLIAEIQDIRKDE
jgi:hypothetical protein